VRVVMLPLASWMKVTRLLFKAVRDEG